MAIKTFSQQRYLFTDLRHIRCGDLEWFSPEGDILGVNPSGPAVQARADTGFVPYGIRLEGKQASREIIPNAPKTGRIIFDGGMYRSWYIQTDPAVICYIESKDGFEWTSPIKSPLQVPPGRVCHEFVYFIDNHGPASERYKCVYPVWATPSEMPALWKDYQTTEPRYRDLRFNEHRLQRMFAAVSPDGVNWTSLDKPLMYYGGDTDTTLYYDNYLRKYVLYTRQYIQERRWVGRAESDDFRNWGPIESIIWPSLDWPFSHDIYLNGRCSYPGLDEYHLMFPWVYDRFTQGGAVYLYTSEDGISWNKIPGEHVVPVTQGNDYDTEFVEAVHDLVPFKGNTVGIVSFDTTMPHKYPRWKGTTDDYGNYKGGAKFWATWPEGRLCGIVADEDGEFFTFPMIPQGRQLRLNARVHRGGDLRVGLMVHGEALPDTHMYQTYNNRTDIPGRTVNDCDPIFGNDQSITVHWDGHTDIATKEGAPITLQFKLRAAELFGFEWV